MDERKPPPERPPIQRSRHGPTPSEAPEERRTPFAIQNAVRQAVDRIAEWAPKGVHFGWESAFKNKGKFLATMTKEDARALIQEALQQPELQIYPNQREGRVFADQIAVVSDLGRSIGTKGQTRIRIVLIRDANGYVVDNAFPVRIR